MLEKTRFEFHSRQTSKRNDKICTCISSAWDVDQGILLLDHVALVVASCLLGITQRSIATTAEIHIRCNSSACAVPVKAVTPAAFEAKIADCRVAISAKHLTSTWRTSCTSMLSVACSEMTESSRLRFDCGPSRCVSVTLMKPNNLKGGTS